MEVNRSFDILCSESCVVTSAGVLRGHGGLVWNANWCSVRASLTVKTDRGRLTAEKRPCIYLTNETPLHGFSWMGQRWRVQCGVRADRRPWRHLSFGELCCRQHSMQFSSSCFIFSQHKSDTNEVMVAQNTHTHARTHAHTHTHTHARTHARTHTHTHTHTV